MKNKRGTRKSKLQGNGMDFSLNKEQEAIQAAAKEFAAGEFNKELALELEKTHSFPVEIWKKAGALGFIGIHFPEEYGG